MGIDPTVPPTGGTGPRSPAFSLRSGPDHVVMPCSNRNYPGLRGHQPELAGSNPETALTLNRGHWTIKAMRRNLAWSFDEKRSRIRSGHGPENMARLRRFAIGVIQDRGLGVAETMRNLARNRHRILNFLKMMRRPSACPVRPFAKVGGVSVRCRPTASRCGSFAGVTLRDSQGVSPSVPADQGRQRP